MQSSYEIKRFPTLKKNKSSTSLTLFTFGLAKAQYMMVYIAWFVTLGSTLILAMHCGIQFLIPMGFRH